MHRRSCHLTAFFPLLLLLIVKVVVSAVFVVLPTKTTASVGPQQPLSSPARRGKSIIEHTQGSLLLLLPLLLSTILWGLQKKMNSFARPWCDTSASGGGGGVHPNQHVHQTTAGGIVVTTCSASSSCSTSSSSIGLAPLQVRGLRSFSLIQTHFQYPAAPL